MMNQQVEWRQLIGKVVTAVTVAADNSCVTISCADGSEYVQYHGQCCCEKVGCQGVEGEMSHLIGLPIVNATWRASNKHPRGVRLGVESHFLWQFFELETAKGPVTIRWLAHFSNCECSWNTRLILDRVSHESLPR